MDTTQKIAAAVLGVGAVVGIYINQPSNFVDSKETATTTPISKTLKVRPIATSTPTGTKGLVVENGVVTNTVVLPKGWPDIPNAWIPPADTQIILNDDGTKEDTFDGTNFYRETLSTEP